MDTKDAISLIGVGVAVVAMVASYYNSKRAVEISKQSLALNMENRSNALREHLYKEQLSFLLKLRKCFAQIMFLIDDAEQEEVDRSIYDKIYTAIEEADNLFDSNDTLVPDNLYSTINEAISQAYLYQRYLREPTEDASYEEMTNAFTDAFYDMEDEMREFIGLDKLSDQNRSLTNSERNP